jgi:hypothetical protein
MTEKNTKTDIVVLLIGNDAALSLIARKVRGQDGRIVVLTARTEREVRTFVTHSAKIDLVMFVNEVSDSRAEFFDLAGNIRDRLSNTRMYADTGIDEVDTRLVKSCGCIEALGSRSTISHIIEMARALRPYNLAELAG